jgi:hypothetical protein
MTAEVPGLGGIPARAVETENVLFIVSLLAFVGVVRKKFGRHLSPGLEADRMGKRLQEAVLRLTV